VTLASDVIAIAMDVNPIVPSGNFARELCTLDLIILGAITSTVEVRINPIFDNSLTELDSVGSVRCGTAQQHGASTATILVLLHVTLQNHDHGMADTRVATTRSGAFSRLTLCHDRKLLSMDSVSLLWCSKKKS